MRLNLQALTLAAVAVAVSAAALAGDVYKYIDADGNVHYVDRPTGEPSEQRLAIVSKPTDQSAVQARVQARVDVRNTAREAAAVAPEEPTREDIRSEREKRQQECQAFRDRLERFVQSRRLYREDEQGERVYLDEEQTRTARDRVAQQIQEHCDS
ncbi:MAG: DUF4124 domain-containing protein [Proteobacteria bacterium]|nr:DUF4124 domain-containing protein [Pseudomonadota bacterium]